MLKWLEYNQCIGSAQTIIQSMKIYYNFIRKHQTINCCSYELATDLVLESPNKWLELIEMSKLE